jgi:CubicO group peptidase (beta-lactamase class C family)
LGKEIEAAIASVSEGAFWGGVLVGKDGKILFAKGFGFADRKSQPMTTHSLFDIGSTAKQFTAAAVLKSEMQGKLSTDDAICKYIKDVPVDKQDVTLGHLLTHMSGLPRELSLETKGFTDRDAFVQALMRAKMKSKPGERFEYNNVGYFLLAAIIETVSGDTFEAYLAKNIFQPAGMTETGFVGDKRLNRENETARVWGGVEGTVLDYSWNWANRGATGVVTTVLDMYKWDRALRSDKVLSAPAREKLFKSSKSGYSFGLYVEKTPRGTTCVEHGGTTRGYSSEYCRFLEEDAVIVILSNNEGNVRRVRGAIEGVLFPREGASLEATMYLLPYTLNKVGLTEISGRTKWRVMPQYVGRDEQGQRVVDPRATLVVVDAEKHFWPVIVKMDASLVRTLASDVEHVLNQKSANNKDESALPAMDLVLATRPYKISEHRSIKLPPTVSWRVLPQYISVDESGERHVDDRVTLVLMDEASRFWPVIVKMNAAAANALLDGLKSVSP